MSGVSFPNAGRHLLIGTFTDSPLLFGPRRPRRVGANNVHFHPRRRRRPFHVLPHPLQSPLPGGFQHRILQRQPAPRLVTRIQPVPLHHPPPVSLLASHRRRIIREHQNLGAVQVPPGALQVALPHQIRPIPPPPGQETLRKSSGTAKRFQKTHTLVGAPPEMLPANRVHGTQHEIDNPGRRIHHPQLHRGIRHPLRDEPVVNLPNDVRFSVGVPTRLGGVVGGGQNLPHPPIGTGKSRPLPVKRHPLRLQRRDHVADTRRHRIVPGETLVEHGVEDGDDGNMVGHHFHNLRRGGTAAHLLHLVAQLGKYFVDIVGVVNLFPKFGLNSRRRLPRLLPPGGPHPTVAAHVHHFRSHLPGQLQRHLLHLPPPQTGGNIPLPPIPAKFPGPQFLGGQHRIRQPVSPTVVVGTKSAHHRRHRPIGGAVQNLVGVG